MITKSSDWCKILQRDKEISAKFLRLRNQPVIAAENLGGEENLSSVVIPTKSKVMDGQLKLDHRVVDVVDRANRKICVTLLRYSVDKSKSS